MKTPECPGRNDFSACPPLHARAPRCAGPGPQPHSRLYPAPPGLQGAVVAVACRDTRGVALDDAQRLSHFPATPMVCLSWYQDMAAGLVGEGGCRPFASCVMLSGSQTTSTASWADRPGRGGMACLHLDAALKLFGPGVIAVQDSFAAAHEVLGAPWSALCQALLAAEDDASTLRALQRHLAPRWREVGAGGNQVLPSLREHGRHWVAWLGMQALQWHHTLGARQVERRIKLFSGRSLRQWQGIIRTESLFHAARQRHAQGLPLDWAALALDEGFSDQAHMCRAVRQITGFSPGEFARRFEHDESFWMYRLWV
ncbi:helix-turn-helix domain-containing protein [Delftia tsuruhatensis]|uniref:helix-turn-helix domain-containing protein n=1 Tax=Delftia tsuruhatensis TaxID=180282 RepID=UPI001EF70062|nr:helix-turn-helix domain-containing protein [Delftia tsuruhatensis]